MAGLILVDVQYDFLPGGALAVKEADTIITPILDELLPPASASSSSQQPWRTIVATQDYHPVGHISFASSHTGAKPLDTRRVSHPLIKGEEIDQVMWPDHCVQGTRGAEIEDHVAARLRQIKTSEREAPDIILVQKGTDPHVDGYSGLSDNAQSRFTPLVRYLSSRRPDPIDVVVVCGLATDYCVLYTAMDLVKFGYKVLLPREATRGVDAQGSQEALDKLEAAGVKVVQTAREAKELARQMVKQLEARSEESYLGKFELEQKKVWEEQMGRQSVQ
ncbi:Isochorismatase hydrolase [Jaminaea rosea]|uniref:nicotinamidase n=1 Tax=Jaminaea rosea TaxID=1569628 RepID=A0A316UMJ1_9BASI|nr:Isochorismatase hydrolase [Jaminaea rosea]PWN26469.1 Isochorismatase hydrolase [Jaminaea rosea]